MTFADLDLARRLERAEGFAGAQFAAARSRLLPESGSTWTECAGATLIFDGVDAPTTQTFGLGLFAEATADALDEMERFFATRGAETMHEVCPLAGNGAPDCQTAASNACKTKGFKAGQPVDIRTAESCTASLWVSGQNSPKGECPVESMVLRAACE